jgi:hypothetical protein
VNHLLRVALLLHPRSFRREYGDVMAVALRDERRHRGRLGLAAVFDVALAAPRQRWESYMSLRHPVQFGIVAAFGGLVLIALAGPIGLIALAVLVGVAVTRQQRGESPIVRTTQWLVWLLAGVGVIGATITAAVVNGEFDSELVWTGWMVLLMTGLMLTVTGVVLGALHLRQP